MKKLDKTAEEFETKLANTTEELTKKNDEMAKKNEELAKKNEELTKINEELDKKLACTTEELEKRKKEIEERNKQIDEKSTCGRSETTTLSTTDVIITNGDEVKMVALPKYYGKYMPILILPFIIGRLYRYLR